MQESDLIKKEKKYKNILCSYGYNVSNDNCERAQDSRHCGNNYRQNCIIKSCDS